MKKLTNREIAALAHTLRPKPGKIPAEVKKMFKRKVAIWNKTPDAQVFVKYDVKVPPKDILGPVTYNEMQYFIDNWHNHGISSSAIEVNAPSLTYRYLYIIPQVAEVNHYDIENALIIAQIESTDLDELIATVKKKLEL